MEHVSRDRQPLECSIPYNEQSRTCLATLPLELFSAPLLSSSRIVPIGASAATAVVMDTLSDIVQRDARASPRKPKLRTRARSSKVESLDV